MPCWITCSQIVQIRFINYLQPSKLATNLPLPNYSLTVKYSVRQCLWPGRGRGFSHILIIRLNMCRCASFQNIQYRKEYINHLNYCLEQDIKLCNIYKLFGTGCNNSSGMRIGLTRFWCTWVFPDSQAWPV